MTFGAGWYPVALSKDLDPGKSSSARLFDLELCIWRDSDGNVHAWEDRCPHRGMRLSFGFVRGTRIACLYHGWQYDAEGQCRFIPAHPDLDVPATIHVTAYRSIERAGMVWVYSDRSTETPPDLAVEPRDVVPVRSLYIDCAPDVVLRTIAPPTKNVGCEHTLLALDADSQNAIAGIQPVGKTKTALHIALPGLLTPQLGAVRHAVAAWAQELRRSLEEEETGSGGRTAAREAVQ